MTVSERIFIRLNQLSMSQKEFSEKTGIPQSTISDWRGKGINPNVDKIMVISEALGISVEDLLSGETEIRNKGVDYICIDKDSREYGIVLEYRRLDHEGRARLEGYLRALQEQGEHE